MYARLNHLNMCVSYSATLRLMDEVCKLYPSRTGSKMMQCSSSGGTMWTSNGVYEIIVLTIREKCSICIAYWWVVAEHLRQSSNTQDTCLSCQKPPTSLSFLKPVMYRQ